jgi:hypothetical protein
MVAGRPAEIAHMAIGRCKRFAWSYDSRMAKIGIKEIHQQSRSIIARNTGGIRYSQLVHPCHDNFSAF